MVERVVLLVECTTATPHFETTIEILLGHLSNGTKVIYLPTYKIIRYTEFGTEESKSKAALADKELESFQSDNFHYFAPKKWKVPEISIPARVSQLKTFELFGIRFGRAIVASCSSMSGGFPANDDFEFPVSLTNIAFETGWITFLNVLSVFDNHRITDTVIFNGRFVTSLPVVELSKSKGIDCFVHERGTSEYLYTLKSYPDTFDRNVDDINVYATEKSIIELDQRAASFFVRQRYGMKEIWHESPQFPDFVKGASLESSTPDKYVFFHSNLDEFFSLPESTLDNGLGDQLLAIEILADVLNIHTELLTIRLHPILSYRSAFLSHVMERLSPLRNCKIIGPSELTNSYELLDNASIIFHVGSTIGFEAIYRGKISVCLGRSVFSHLFPELSPNTKSELISLVRNPPRVTEEMKERVRRFGAASYQVGIPYYFYKPLDLFNGSISLSVWLNRLI